MRRPIIQGSVEARICYAGSHDKGGRFCPLCPKLYSSPRRRKEGEGEERQRTCVSVCGVGVGAGG